MLSPTFHRLPEHRQQLFLEVCLEEFASHPFVAASTNRMVEQLGTSKGLLYKYARSKEALYLHLYELVFEEIGAIQGDPAIYTSPDLFVRVGELTGAALVYARANEAKFRFSLRASIDVHPVIQNKAQPIRDRIAAASAEPLLGGVDWSLYRLPREEVMRVFTWLLGGTKILAVEELHRDFTIDRYEALVRSQLSLMRKLFRGGIYASEEQRT